MAITVTFTVHDEDVPDFERYRKYMIESAKVRPEWDFDDCAYILFHKGLTERLLDIKNYEARIKKEAEPSGPWTNFSAPHLKEEKPLT